METVKNQQKYGLLNTLRQIERSLATQAVAFNTQKLADIRASFKVNYDMIPEVYEKMFQQQSWHWWYRTKRQYISSVLSSLKLKSGTNILDLGSGVGANFPVLRKYGKVVGVEFSSLAIKLSRQIHPEKILQQNINDIDLKEMFDVICILDVLYHQNIKDDTLVLKSLMKNLKTNGTLIVTDCAHPFYYGQHDKENMARERYSLNRMKKIIKDSGFFIEKSSYLFSFSFPLFILARMTQKVTGNDDQKEDKSSIMNDALSLFGMVEARLLRYVSLPFGSSILVVARKK